VTARIARPLPECTGEDCGMPVRRDTYLANGGLCTDCRLRRDHSTPTQLELVGLPDPEAE
jgi:hypothetical protein